MASKTKIEVTPIYGWGWARGGLPTGEVPDPFLLTLDEVDFEGLVTDPGHVFDGRRERLSQRHTDGGQAANIEVAPFQASGQSDLGFGLVDERIWSRNER